MRWLMILGLCMVVLSGCAQQVDTSADASGENVEPTVSVDSSPPRQSGLTFVSAGSANATDGNVTIGMDISVME